MSENVFFPFSGLGAWLRRHIKALGIGVVTLTTGAVLAMFVLPSGATLSGSTFNAGDGNMTVQGGEKDWANVTLMANVPDSYKGNILPGEPGDDAFANGAKEDDNPPNVGYGGVPPNKDDFTRMYIATEHKATAPEKDYLYMAWLRTDNPGTAFEAFEFNQSSTISSNGKTPVRTAGDVLVLYDLDNGGTVPTISISRWITDNLASACDNTKHVAPCWATRSFPNSAAEEASINGSAFVDPISGSSQPVRTFGEAAINLQDSGIFGTGCTHLGKASLTSRSSSSLDSTMKDLVGPANVSITNCGTVTIHKQDDTSAQNPMGGVRFTLWTDNSPKGTAHGTEDVATSYTCVTDVTTGDCSIANVPFGNYWAVEGTPPTGYNAADDQYVTLGGGTTTVNLTFTNNRRPASLKLHKQDDSVSPNPLSGVNFTLYKENAPTGSSHGTEDTVTAFQCGIPSGGSTPGTDAAGDCTISNILPAGSYWVVETTSKPGYGPAPDRLVTLALGQDLDITSVPFVDKRYFKIIVLVCRQADGTLYPTPIAVDGIAVGNSLSTAQAGTASLSESALCGISTGAASDKYYGNHPAGANIPQ